MNQYDTRFQKLTLVNEEDEIIGSAAKMAAHEQGLLHRAFSVMLYRFNLENALEVLLQKRHADKYHCGGLWTNTCCGHPNFDEPVADAAKRRLFEETNIKTDLRYQGRFIYKAHFENGLTEHELDHVFTVEFDITPAHFNEAEIAAMRWISLAALQCEMNTSPALFTPWLGHVLKFLPSRKA